MATRTILGNQKKTSRIARGQWRCSTKQRAKRSLGEPSGAARGLRPRHSSTSLRKHLIHLQLFYVRPFPSIQFFYFLQNQATLSAQPNRLSFGLQGLGLKLLGLLREALYLRPGRSQVASSLMTKTLFAAFVVRRKDTDPTEGGTGGTGTHGDGPGRKQEVSTFGTALSTAGLASRHNKIRKRVLEARTTGGGASVIDDGT
jgi:hypothetical protein